MELELTFWKMYNPDRYLLDPVFRPDKLKYLRERADLTQVDVAHACNVSVNTISSLEVGRFYPSCRLLDKLIYLLDCKYSDLLTYPSGRWSL